VILSFVQCPHIGDDPEHFALLHAAAMERLHRAACSAIDDRKHSGIRQHLFVDDILAEERRANFAGSIGAMADDAVRCVKPLAVGYRIGIAAIIVVPRFVECLDGRRFDLAGLKFERYRRVV
jgi:hypothetical protein